MSQSDLLHKTPIRDISKIESAQNLWVYKECSKDFYFGNIDGYCYKKATNIFRVIEWKYNGERLSDGESFVLPILSKLLAVAVYLGFLAKGSGVYVVSGNPPFNDGADIRAISTNINIHYSYVELREFIECRK